MEPHPQGRMVAAGAGGQREGRVQRDTVPVWDDWVLVSGSGGSCAVRTRSVPLDRALKNG